MNSELYRKLTSITLMTIMLAGGMTIAIPSETPVAVAQTGMLSVSATAAPGNSFGGPQIIEIVVDDPSRSDIADRITLSGVTVDGTDVTMRQADTGKWYAYVADTSAVADANGVLDTGIATATISDPPKRSGVTFELETVEFKNDSDIDVVLGNEVITLHYEDDLDDLATVSVGRTVVPKGGQIHVTVSDFRLNLDPTGADEWVVYTNGSTAAYNDDGANAIIDGENWVGIFGGGGGEFTVTADDGVVDITDAPTTPPVGTITLTETGANTGVFTSENADGGSNIEATGDENDSFTIAYADDSVQVLIEDFVSTLEMIADGTWDSGESLTVRLTSENLNINILDDANMGIVDEFPVLILGEPITLKDLDSAGTYDDESAATDEVPRGTIKVNSNTYVGALAIPDTDSVTSVEFTLDLTEGQVDQINSGASYIQYMGPAVTIGGFDAEVTFEDTDLDDVVLTAAGITDEVDADGNDVTSGAPITLTYTNTGDNSEGRTVIFDIFTFGADANDAIYRILLEETGSGSGVFEATIEYQMLNQRTVNDATTHQNVDAIGFELAMILDKDYTGGDAPEVTYDADGPGGDAPANASEDAPTNTGEVSVDAATYRVSDDVTITLVDADLNTDSGAREIYRIANSDGTIEPRLASIAIGDLSCASEIGDVSLRETADDSGVFEGSFTVPGACGAGDNPPLATGESITVAYVDFRDENGGDSEWTDSAIIGADTGSVSLDRTVYPVPPGDKVTIAVSVDESDADTSSSSTQTIGADRIELTVAGVIVDLVPLKETDTDTGIFKAEKEIGTSVTGIDANDPDVTKTVRIEQGDVITVKYTDESDASGNENSVFDSATFDLRNAVLQSDKSTYVIGQDALITLIEPDRNLDSGTVDSVDLTRIAWDSDAATTDLDDSAFGAVPQSLRETGPDTGIFQVVITIPEKIPNNDDGTELERGEAITLTYEDRGPSGADVVGEDEREVDLLIKTSDFGATIKLDQNVYTWTDRVFITIVASDYNFDSNIVDEIGAENKGEITIRTRGKSLDQYRLAETGRDTGVFTGEIALTGQKDEIDKGSPTGRTVGNGPTNGELEAKSADGLSVSFDFSGGEAPLVASALIRWNVGEVQWLEASHAATGSGIVRVIDPDMNLNPDAVDNLGVAVYSETFVGGIELTVTETQEASGIFEGTVEFGPDQASQGHRLQVTEGDIVTAAYDDVTTPDGDDLEITATALIGSIVPPLERAPASNPAIADAFGNSLASVSVDQQVQITADITSGQDRNQDFAYLVQIQNEDGVTVALSWIAGTIGAGATFSQSQSWTPDATGSYTATIFVWESVSNPTTLSPQLSIAIDVV